MLTKVCQRVNYTICLGSKFVNQPNKLSHFLLLCAEQRDGHNLESFCPTNLTYWLISSCLACCLFNRSGDRFIEEKTLLLAVRSYVFFSQLSAWLSASHGIVPRNILYRWDSLQSLTLFGWRLNPVRLCIGVDLVYILSWVPLVLSEDFMWLINDSCFLSVTQD